MTQIKDDHHRTGVGEVFGQYEQRRGYVELAIPPLGTHLTGRETFELTTSVEIKKLNRANQLLQQYKKYQNTYLLVIESRQNSKSNIDSNETTSHFNIRTYFREGTVKLYKQIEMWTTIKL